MLKYNLSQIDTISKKILSTLAISCAEAQFISAIVTFPQLADLLEEDETPERDINIGLNNAKAIQGDIKGRSIKTVYWVPRQKPKNVNPTNPTDTVIEFDDGFLQG